MIVYPLKNKNHKFNPGMQQEEENTNKPPAEQQAGITA